MQSFGQGAVTSAIGSTGAIGKYGAQMLTSAAGRALNHAVDKRNSLGFSVWGADFSIDRNGKFSGQMNAYFAVEQRVALINGLTGLAMNADSEEAIGFDTETLSIRSNSGVAGWIGKKTGTFIGIAPYSILDYSGHPRNADAILNHERNHIWHHRYWGNGWIAPYMLDSMILGGARNFYDTQADNGF